MDTRDFKNLCNFASRRRTPWTFMGGLGAPLTHIPATSDTTARSATGRGRTVPKTHSGARMAAVCRAQAPMRHSCHSATVGCAGDSCRNECDAAGDCGG